MKKIYFFLTITFCTHISLFAQKQEKIYYDKDWKGCSQSEAEFYRIVSYDANGKLIGKVYDYFITGELQSEIDGAISIDKFDDHKSKFIGYSKDYYKNGMREHEIFHDDYGNQKWCKNWDENGKLYRRAKSTDGKLDKFFIECDEFGKCQNVFEEKFYTCGNQWDLTTEKDYAVELLLSKGLLMKNKTNGFRETINIPLDLTNNFK